MAWIEAQAHLSYVTGLTSNAVLKRNRSGCENRDHAAA
jgi:hypothetical protein